MTKDAVTKKAVTETIVAKSKVEAVKEKTEKKEVAFSDAALVKRAAKGDKEAYQLLVEKYQQRAFSIAFDLLRNREDAEDVVQESFVKAYLSLPNFRGASSFYTWFYRIVYNMAIDFKRKMARHTQKGNAEFDERQHSAADVAGPGGYTNRGPHEELLRKEQAHRIEDVLSEISDEHRAVIMFRELDGMNYDQIAEAIGVSKGTIMSRLHYARKKLQRSLKDLVSDDANSEQDKMDQRSSKMPKLLTGVL